MSAGEEIWLLYYSIEVLMLRSPNNWSNTLYQTSVVLERCWLHWLPSDQKFMSSWSVCPTSSDWEPGVCAGIGQTAAIQVSQIGSTYQFQRMWLDVAFSGSQKSEYLELQISRVS